MKRISTTKQIEEDSTSSTSESSDFNSNNASIDVARNPSLFYFASKRFIDIVLATFGIAVLMPLFFVISVCIKLDDGANILYFREMIGLRGRRFNIVKFRTMIPNADAYLEQHPQLMLEYQKNMKLPYDPRVTRLGKFLRKTYLDELPQLFNVLAGHMSLVGPRTLPANELALYGEYGQKRLAVKPGITGLWQISENRYNNYDKRIPLDMRYIDDRSLFLDLLILLKTLKTLIVQAGV